MKITELRAKSKEELAEMVTSLKKEQFNLRFQSATGALESRVRFRQVRKDIARAKTLLNEKPAGEKKAVVKAAPAAKKPAAAKKAPAKKTKAKKEE